MTTRTGNSRAVSLVRACGLLAAIALALMSAPTAARATITVSPPVPTETDSVRVTVGSAFPTRCWEVEQQRCEGWLADTLEIRVRVQYCRGYSGCGCVALPSGYSLSCPVALLPRGTYVVRFREEHINPADPMASFTQLRTFSVGESTPTVRATWGQLKVRHR